MMWHSSSAMTFLSIYITPSAAHQSLHQGATHLELEPATMKFLYLMVLLVVASMAIAEVVDGAGECGRVPADRVALRLAPCASAAQDPNADVSARCCSEVHTLGQNPSCLCAVLLSNTAKMAGIKPEVAITVPKRCNLADRPVGYKCGSYTLP